MHFFFFFPRMNAFDSFLNYEPNASEFVAPNGPANVKWLTMKFLFFDVNVGQFGRNLFRDVRKCYVLYRVGCREGQKIFFCFQKKKNLHFFLH